MRMDAAMFVLNIGLYHIYILLKWKYWRVRPLSGDGKVQKWMKYLKTAPAAFWKNMRYWGSCLISKVIPYHWIRRSGEIDAGHGAYDAVGEPPYTVREEQHSAFTVTFFRKLLTRKWNLKSWSVRRNTFLSSLQWCWRWQRHIRLPRAFCSLIPNVYRWTQLLVEHGEEKSDLHEPAVLVRSIIKTGNMQELIYST